MEVFASLLVSETRRAGKVLGIAFTCSNNLTEKKKSFIYLFFLMAQINIYLWVLKSKKRSHDLK
jgi:hypothetical protein